ncbi:MAG: Gfo/Idh/MocA family protein [Anaerolineae bacterium]
MAQAIRIGIIGFDTSHVPAFTRLLNDPSDPHHVPGGRVVCGVPTFSPDLAASASRVEGFKKQVTEDFGVPLVESIEEMLDQVDAVLLESVDGRRHLAEARPVIAARKPLFVDKPLAADYRESAEIVRLAEEAGCPLFSSSSLRFDVNLTDIQRDPELGAVVACDAFSPATLDPTNPGFFWYGVHGVEILYTFMGAGCQEVTAQSGANGEVAIGYWADGRIGAMRGTRAGAHDYGATVFGASKVRQAMYSREVPLYAGLMQQIVRFFGGAPTPVSLAETLEIMAFMQAELVSVQEGRTVLLDEVR